MGLAAEQHQKVAHGVSRGNRNSIWQAPAGAKEILYGILSPLRGSRRQRTLPTARAVGYRLPLLRGLKQHIFWVAARPS